MTWPRLTFLPHLCYPPATLNYYFFPLSVMRSHAVAIFALISLPFPNPVTTHSPVSISKKQANVCKLPECPLGLSFDVISPEKFGGPPALSQLPFFGVLSAPCTTYHPPGHCLRILNCPCVPLDCGLNEGRGEIFHVHHYTSTF